MTITVPTFTIFPLSGLTCFQDVYRLFVIKRPVRHPVRAYVCILFWEELCLP